MDRGPRPLRRGAGAARSASSRAWPWSHRGRSGPSWRRTRRPSSSSTTFAPPSAKSGWARDVLGRDVLIEGPVRRLAAPPDGRAATALGIVVGAARRRLAAYSRGWADGLIMRTVDVLLAFPQSSSPCSWSASPGRSCGWSWSPWPRPRAPGGTGDALGDARHLRDATMSRPSSSSRASFKIIRERSCPTWSRRSWSRPVCA